MNIILDNIIFDLQKVGGISKFWAKHIENLQSNNLTFECIESSKSEQNIFRGDISIVKNSIKKNMLSEWPLSRYLPVNIGRRDNSIFHSSYFRNPINSHVPVVLTVHDFMHEKFESGFKKKLHITQKKASLKRADVIVCVSNKTKEDMFRIYPWTKNKNVQVVYNGVDNEFYPIASKVTPLLINGLELYDSSYLLYVGARGYCKNFSYVVDFMASQYVKDKELKLVCVGGDFTTTEVQMFKNRGVFKQIIKLDVIESTVLNKLYNYSKALLMPSIYEGFGIPALEAARTGTIVLGGNNSSIPEVLGNETFLFSPFNFGEAINALEKLDDTNLVESVSNELLIHSKEFSWGKMTSQYTNIYKEIVN